MPTASKHNPTVKHSHSALLPPRPACAEPVGVRRSAGTDRQLADSVAPGGFGLVHVLGDHGGIDEFAGSHRAHDIGQREVAGAVLEIERSYKAVVALLGVGRVGELGKPGIVSRGATL